MQSNAGSTVDFTASDSVMHAFQALYDNAGGGSSVYVDGASTGTLMVGAAAQMSGGCGAIMGDVYVCTDAPDLPLTGKLFEGGFWGSAFSSGQAGSMNSNQHTYWGF